MVEGVSQHVFSWARNKALCFRIKFVQISIWKSDKSVKANSSPKGFLLTRKAVVAKCKAWKGSRGKAHGFMEPPSELLDSWQGQ